MVKNILSDIKRFFFPSEKTFLKKPKDYSLIFLILSGFLRHCQPMSRDQSRGPGLRSFTAADLDASVKAPVNSISYCIHRPLQLFFLTFRETIS